MGVEDAVGRSQESRRASLEKDGLEEGSVSGAKGVGTGPLSPHLRLVPLSLSSPVPSNPHRLFAPHWNTSPLPTEGGPRSSVPVGPDGAPTPSRSGDKGKPRPDKSRHLRRTRDVLGFVVGTGDWGPTVLVGVGVDTGSFYKGL